MFLKLGRCLGRSIPEGTIFGGGFEAGEHGDAGRSAEGIGRAVSGARRADKTHILTDFAEVTRYHRKHAERLLRGGNRSDRSRPRPERRLYDDAVREALIVLWEASDRFCGKRLKPLITVLIESMERHGHLALDGEVRAHLFALVV